MVDSASSGHIADLRWGRSSKAGVVGEMVWDLKMATSTKICAAAQDRVTILKYWMCVGVCWRSAPMSQRRDICQLAEIFGFHNSFPGLFWNGNSPPTGISRATGHTCTHTHTSAQPCNATTRSNLWTLNWHFSTPMSKLHSFRQHTVWDRVLYHLFI